MSTSGFSQFLAGIGLRPPEGRSSLIGGETNARLIGVPGEVRNEIMETRRPVRIQGEVTQVRSDGSVRVKTERGDVEFKPAEGQKIPQEGQSVEIEIPPNANAKKTPNALVYRPMPGAGKTPESAQAETRTSSTPVEVDVRTARPERAEQAQAPPIQTTGEHTPLLPPEGTILRLQPLAENEAAAAPPPEIEAAALPPEEVLQQAASLRVREVVTQMSQTLMEVTDTPDVMAVKADAATSPLLIQAEAAGGYFPAGAPATMPDATNFTGTPISSTPESAGWTGGPDALPGTAIGKLKAFVMQKIAFGSLSPALLAPRDAAIPMEPAAPPEPGKTINATLTIMDTPPVLLTGGMMKAEQHGEMPRAAGIPITHAHAPEALITLNQSAGMLSGVVTGHTPHALPLLSVHFPQSGQTFGYVLQYPSPMMPVGTMLGIMPQDAASATPTQNMPGAVQAHAAIQAPGLPLPPMAMPQPWPVMDEIYQSLAQSSPQAAHAFAQTVPSPAANPAQFAPAVLFFVAAMRGGDVTQWLSERTIETLKGAGKTSLLSRLTQEGSLLSRLAAEPMAQEWRAANVPMFAQGEMHKIALYYRHEHEGESGQSAKGGKNTRFVFDLKLSAMGQVQIDGLFRPVSDSGKRLDLIVRTEQFFSQAAQAEMRRIYTRALRDTEVGGELSFQGHMEDRVSVMRAEGNTLTISS